MEKETTKKEDVKECTQEVALETIISNAIQIPGVKVDRERFLGEILAKETNDLQKVLNEGPILAGLSEITLRKIANKLILNRTSKSALASFAMGIPGGLAMAATIPGDIIQFYGVLLRLAQELSYLYGAQNIWQDGKVDEEIVRNQLILYCGVMLGVSGAVAGVRLLSTQVAKVVLKKLPQKALTKTFWYPIVKKIGSSVGLKITKKALTNGLTKAIPVIGGVVSGAVTFASMKPMAERLLNALEEVNFHYTEEELEIDIETVDSMDGVKDIEADEFKQKSIFNKGKEKLTKFFKKKEEKSQNNFDQIKKLKELFDEGIITEEEFNQKKKQILGL